MPKYIVTFAPQIYSNATGPAALLAENQIDAAPGPREFVDRDDAANYLNSYWYDEWAETQGHKGQYSQPALYRAYAQTYAGFAQGGNFAVEFGGDKATVEVRYVSMGELLCEFVQAEFACIHATPADAEGQMPGEADVGMAIAELAQALPMFGPQMAEWAMRVEPYDAPAHPDEPAGEFVFSNASVSVPYCVNGKYLQMECAMGRVTFWPL